MKMIHGVFSALVLATSSMLPGTAAAQTDDGWSICSNQVVVEALNFSVAPIKSEAELKAYLRDGGTKKAPLSYLSKGAQQRFLRSITFNETGVTGYRFDDIEAELTLSQAYAVLALIGDQHNIKFLENARLETDLDHELYRIIKSPSPACSGDYKHYSCTRPANCDPRTGSICKSNC
ncbi:MAG: hypothetical protein ACK4RW_03220 [Rehaibacterium terrae]|uniref:hypothetical protein n=1 Tax=Rehaibacterium terrae TaxID=1341696 RepID=UPI00391C1A54